MEDKCSECGKIVGTNAHRNMKGEFRNQILCGLCYDSYKTNLEERWKSMRRTMDQLYQKSVQISRNMNNYRAGSPEINELNRMTYQISKELSMHRKFLDEVREKYRGLTGRDLAAGLP